MKLIAGFLVLLVAFTFGVITDSSLTWNPTKPRMPVESTEFYRHFPNVAHPPEGIIVTYGGRMPGQIGEVPHLSFIVYNGTDRWLHYSAEYPSHMFSDAGSNWEPLDYRASCGADMEGGNIPPRTAAEVKIFTCAFSARTERKDLVMLAIPLLPAGESAKRLFFTPWFALPEDFRGTIDASQLDH